MKIILVFKVYQQVIKSFLISVELHQLLKTNHLILILKVFTLALLSYTTMLIIIQEKFTH